MCKFVCGLWANITQVIFLWNGYFPSKRWLCVLGQHCTSNFLVQCCLTTCLDNFGWTILFLCNARSLSDNIAQGFYLCNGYRKSIKITFCIPNSPWQSVTAEAFAEAYLHFIVFALAIEMPRHLNSYKLKKKSFPWTKKEFFF